MRNVAFGWLACLLGACAGLQASAPNTPQRAAHLACYQQMQAARAGALLVTPNWHQYRMCMRRRGFEV